MKKIMMIVLISILMFVVGVGCVNNPTDKNDSKYSILLPSGTPLIAIGDLLNDEHFEFEIVNGQDPLMAAFKDNNYDMIIAPLNLGAKLYINNVSSYKLEAIITTNNTYIMSKNVINSIQDLNNKKIMTYGSGSSPWIALNAAISGNDVNATFITQNSASDVTAYFTNDTSEADYYLGAEPNITILRIKNNMNVYTLDISTILSDLDILIQACLFVNPNSDIPEQTLNLIENNIKNMNLNPKAYAENIIDKNPFFTSLGTNVIEQAIPNCNITYLKSSDNKSVIESYYLFLNKYNKNILGGNTPNEYFYN